MVQAFERLFHHPQTVTVDAEWIERYRHERPKERQLQVGVPPEPPRQVPEPHDIQKEALEALEQTRAAGNARGLVVLATGLGKTWLAAFDSVRFGAKRVLFVAHREEILRQALDTFRRIRPDATLGLYTGADKDLTADVLFASIQTLGKATHLRNFGSNAFDYIIIDEFHHAAARTYRRLIDYFDPEFLLGLTATPERTDGGDLLALCGENLVYRCDLLEGIERKHLVPFRYIGVPDGVDYQNIPWRSSRFDEKALEAAVATNARAANALEQYRKHGGERTLAFCCSQRHADFMAVYFRQRRVRAASVHTGQHRPGGRAPSPLARRVAGRPPRRDLRRRYLQRGRRPPHPRHHHDAPPHRIPYSVDAAVRSRAPTPDKDHLSVVDYIGNHRTFLLKPQTLLSLDKGDRELALALEQLQKGELKLPPGCEITYELEAVDILRALLRIPKEPEALRAWYENFRELHQTRPTALEVHHAGYNPRSVGKTHGSWLGFVRAMDDLTEAQERVWKNEAASQFLTSLDTTPMTKSYKMITLLAMLNADELPGALGIEDLAIGFARLARRSATLRADVGDALDDPEALRAHLEKNPIDAWTGGKGTKGKKFFDYEDGVFRTAFDVAPADREAFQELARELADWRLGEYLDRNRQDITEDDIVCKVSHANGRPILFLPDRNSQRGIPTGEQPVTIDGKDYEATFAKIAVNVLREPGNPRNQLPTILRGWFGADAGLPGTNFHVRFKKIEFGRTLEPIGHRPDRDALTLWQSYAREQIPKLFGARTSPQWQQSGFVWDGNNMVLLVTLEKKGQREEHQYEDQFLTPDSFQWQSQNRTTQKGKVGQALKNQQERSINVHLFVRRTGKVEGRAAPFTYCGQLEFVSWKGEKPITMTWRLRSALPPRLAEQLTV